METLVFFLLGCCAVAIVGSLVMLVRNKIVYDVRTRILYEDMDEYRLLPSYDAMLLQFGKWSYESWKKEVSNAG